MYSASMRKSNLAMLASSLSVLGGILPERPRRDALVEEKLARLVMMLSGPPFVAFEQIRDRAAAAGVDLSPEYLDDLAERVQAGGFELPEILAAIDERGKSPLRGATRYHAVLDESAGFELVPVVEPPKIAKSIRAGRKAEPAKRKPAKAKRLSRLSRW